MTALHVVSGVCVADVVDTPGRLIAHAPAKVNLYLEVGPVAADGYHPVVTVLQTLGLHDVVTLDTDAPFSVECEPDLGVPAEENLACRAAHALARVAGRMPEGSIHLEKSIPAGGGLGGGSSDAAAVLRLLCGLWGYDPLDPAVVGVARSLGADVPFFLHGGTALYSGRGDVLVERIATPALDIVVANAGEPVPTGSAYAAFDRLTATPAPGPELLLRAVRSGDVDAVAAALHNDMTGAACTLAPGVADALRLLAMVPGVLATAVAGSGSSVFGVCESADAARDAAEAATGRGWWSVATTTAGPYSTDGEFM